MTYTTQTPIRGTSRGDPDAIAAWAIGKGAKRPDDVRSYLATLYQLCATHGLRFEVAVAQSMHETSDGIVPWVSTWWRNRCNPAGIGITGDPKQNAASRDFHDGPDAARAHFLHLWLYAIGPTIPAGLLPQDDPRWDAALEAGYAGIADTIDDLTNRWGVDDQYAAGIVRWLNRLESAGLLDGPATAPEPSEEPHMAVKFEKRIATNRLDQFAELRDHLAWMTIHENGNPESSPYDEAGFVKGGGGSGKVMYHFTVGVEDGQPIIVQVFPADRRGKHSGNTTGNATSLAVETCQAPPGPLSDAVQSALRELLYMLYTHDPRIDWGDGDYEFSPDRTCGHKDWAGANPGCPEYMTRAWGGVAPVVQAVRDRLATGGGGQPETFARPLPIPALPIAGLPPTLVNYDDGDFVFVDRMVQATRDTPRLQKAFTGAERLNVDVKQGETFMVRWLFRADDGKWYYVTPWWTRIRYEDTEPVDPAAVAA